MITEKQLNYISYLFFENRRYIAPLLKELIDDRSEKKVNITQMVFDDWLTNQSKDTASHIIQNIEAEDWNALRSTLTYAGYYDQARRVYIQINGVVDETDYMYEQKKDKNIINEIIPF